jgi:delta8-fatty-acid desaturase
VTNTVRNWETETLRSFIELTTWLGGIWLAFDTTNSWLVALLCGTLSGWVLVLGGEALTPCLREVEARIRCAYDIASPTEKSPGRRRAGGGSRAVLVDPAIFMLYGTGVLRLIYHNVSDILAACVLAGLAGCALLAISKLIAAWPPTRRAGAILQDRILNTWANWRAFPARSATEACSFLGCTTGAMARYRQPLFAVQAGLLAGMLVCLFSEALGGRWMVPTQGEDRSARLVPLCICAYTVLLSCHWAFAPSGAGRLHAFSLQLLFAICCGASSQLASRCFLAHERTRAFGAAIQQRLTHTVSNWETRPLRSALEVGWTNVITVAMWNTSHNLNLTSVAGIASGMGMVLLSERYLFPPTDVAPIDVPLAAAPPPPPLALDPVPDARTASALSRVVSHAQLSRHNSKGDCWVGVHGRVYDVSKWHAHHPGGEQILLAYAGRDASDQFELFHPPSVAPKLRPFLIGSLEAGRPPAHPVRWGLTSTLEPNPTAPPVDPADAHTDTSQVDPATRDYRELRRAMWAEGQFQPDPVFYALKQALVLAFLAAAFLPLLPAARAAFAHAAAAAAAAAGWDGAAAGARALAAAAAGGAAPAVWQVLLSAALLALCLQQAAFIGHDTLHNGVFSQPRGLSRRRLALSQFNAGLLLGISCDMWLCEHNLHHAYTLRPGEDPQFRYFPLWLQSVKEVPLWLAQLPDPAAAPRLRALAWRGVRMLTRVQHITIAPIAMVVGRYNFMLISWGHAVRRRRWLDVSCMAAHLACFGAFLALLLPTARHRLLFVVSNYALVGVLHVQLLLSHLCTQQFSAEEEASLGVLRFQLATTRNMTTAWWDSWFHGGLEKQVEHHLFPQLPRHRLHDAVPRVRSLAAKHGIPYMEIPFSDALILCGRNLARLSLELATVNPAA